MQVRQEASAGSSPVSTSPVSTGADLAGAGQDFLFATPQPLTAAAPPAASTAPQPSFQSLQLEAMIDRLVEARQSAAGGSVQVSLAHSEFGTVGVRFEQAAGAGLATVALTSSDPGFAPAVQAALAERAPAERPTAANEQASRPAPSSRQRAARAPRITASRIRSTPRPIAGVSAANDGADPVAGFDDASPATAASSSPSARARGLYA